MEEKNLNQGKSRNGIGNALGMALVVIIILVAYICYDKGIILNDNQPTPTPVADKKQKEKEEQKEAQEKTLDIQSNIVQNLYAIFRFDQACYMTVDGLNHSNLVRLRIAYDNISKQNIKTIACTQLAAQKSPYEECGGGQGGYTSYVTADIVEAKVHELFGSDYQVNHESFGTVGHTVQPQGIYMRYEAASKLYAEFTDPAGGTCGGESSQKIVSASTKGDELYLVTTLNHPRDGQHQLTYTFRKDKTNGNYVFVKVAQQ